MEKKTNETLQEMLKWLRFMGLQEAKEVISDALTIKDDKKEREMRIAFEMLDGNTGSKEIASKLSVTRQTVSNWCQKWSKLGIVDKKGNKRQYKHLTSLEDLGLKSPKVSNKTNCKLDDENNER